MGLLMAATNNIDQEIVEYKKAKVFCEQSDDGLLGLVNMNLAGAYLSIHKYDLALHSFKDAEVYFRKYDFLGYMGSVYIGLGEIYLKQGHNQLALQHFHKAVGGAQQAYNLTDVSSGYRHLADFYLNMQQADSSLNYALKTLKVLQTMRSKDLSDAFQNLYKSYQLKHYTDSAYKYQGLALAAKDSSYKSTIQSLADFQKLSFNEKLHSQKLEKEKEDIQTRIRTYVLLVAIGVFMLLAIIFYRNNRQKQKANVLLNQQKDEVQSTLSQLRSTQTQLIQSEKMASLGELTAGIAHEIQNPLNFVNNFSDVNREMISELKKELKNGNIEEALTIAEDLEQNEGKINHHGKRADSIVKGMLEHSRASSGNKELTDINKLADEYLRLAFHGFRAKDKSFNTELITNFDSTQPMVNIVGQDIGRVLLNMYNNAFYAVQQKHRSLNGEYKPVVEVCTTAHKGSVIITIKDNGPGIPEHIKDKIMQPFFTTKPTGEGTGLGLSLGYDIVVKGHGGTISVISENGKGAEFRITVPE
jgi:signal transduction histidine kinase